METNKRYILMLEDDSDDRHITKTFFANLNNDIGLKFLSDPDELLRYMEDCYEAGSLLPGLIILDKYVPAGSGTEVLKIIKEHPAFRYIPTVIVSGSDHPHDIEESYRLGANSYIVKPFSNEQTAKKITTFITYWFEVVELPGVINA